MSMFCLGQLALDRRILAVYTCVRNWNYTRRIVQSVRSKFKSVVTVIEQEQ